jgi:hypothetical protein
MHYAIYILENAVCRRLKVSVASCDVEEICADLNGQGTVGSWEVAKIYPIPTGLASSLERTTHKELLPYKDRESVNSVFLLCDLEIAKAAVQDVIRSEQGDRPGQEPCLNTSVG